MNIHLKIPICYIFSYIFTNIFFSEISKGEGWVGSPCCHLPQSRKCKLACLQAQSTLDLTPSCRHSDELAFFSCIERQETGDQCCSSTEDDGCWIACKKVFASPLTPSLQIRNAVLMNSCSQHSPKVFQCLKNFTHTTPAEDPTKELGCCYMSSDLRCMMSCRRILRTKTTGQEIVDSLTQAGCKPHDRLWQCFLTTDDDVRPKPGTNSRLGRVGMDSAKLQCCFRAFSESCRRLCLKTFRHEWASSWVEFERLCLSRSLESEMSHCLTEVDQPCELGCEGLNFCSNFNHRPTELFRSCNARADQAARRDFEMWKKGMPFMEIPVFNFSTCHPDIWKAVACTLQVKPCNQKFHDNMICRSDCIGLLSKCLNQSRLPEGQTPTTLCEKLSPSINYFPCISISTYVVESKYTHSASEVTHPCKPNPCNEDQVCRVNHDCRFGQPCSPYTCSGGCQMGEMSQLVIPSGTFVRISEYELSRPCYTICKCSANGTLTTCTELPCFLPFYEDGCRVDEGEFYDRNQFSRGCNTCYCDDREVHCSVISCDLPEENDPTQFSRLPCNCPNHYNPVCGINGKTYPSPCLAKCKGLNNNQFQFGNCSGIDPCSPNPCDHQQQCIPRRQVCLSTKQHLCKQYMCVNIRKKCKDEPRFPICDTKGREHSNFCGLFKKKKKFAHFGKCMSHCDRLSPVCGHNGETYPNECAAWVDRVLVDYEGPCTAVRIPSADLSKPRCSSVQCPNATSQCSKVYLPESCCPICGGAIRLTYSQTLADRYVQALSDVTPVVVQKIATELRGHVQVAECDVYGHLSIEGYLIIIVAPVSKTPTRLQVEACIREAENLEFLLQMGRPSIHWLHFLPIFMELSLSIFNDATMIPYHFESHA